MKRLVIPVLVGFIALGLTGCKEKVKPGTADVKREMVSGVKVEGVNLTSVDDTYETSGTVRAGTISTVAARTMGSVTSIKVKEGDLVSAGQLLLVLDGRDMEQRSKAAMEGYREAEKGLEAAKEGRKLADSTYQRYKKLYDEKALTGQEIDQIETQKRIAGIDYERAEAALARASAGVKESKVYQDFTRITSPVSGIVTEKKIEAGSMAMPGMHLFTIEDNASYRLEFNADEKLFGKLKAGMEVSVYIDAIQKEIKGTVSDIVPAVDQTSRSFTVKVALRSEGLKTGFFGRVSVPVGRREALLVPVTAIVERGQLTGVYHVDRNSLITYRLIRTGKKYGPMIEVLSGLGPDERVVTGGTERARDGAVIQETLPGKEGKK